MPSELIMEDGSNFGLYRPGNIVTNFETGNYRSRSYFEYNLQEYNLRFVPNRYTDNAIELMSALLDKIAVNGSPFWIKEPISRAHAAVLGEITASSETTYVLPLDASSVTVAVNGSGDFTSKTVHSAANLLTDAQANGEGGTTGLTTYGTCTISSVRYPALAGRSSILVDPTGTVGNVGAQTASASRVSVSGSQRYTVGASVLVTNTGHTYGVQGQFYDGATPSGSAFTDSGTGEVGEWLHFRASQVSGASDDGLNVRVYRTTSSSDSFQVGCLLAAPGDLERWFMPSLAPRAIEWASAPTAGERITFAAESCQRWTRVVLARNRHSITVELLGDATQRDMAVDEIVFREGE
jgi:hypothetical protein